MTGADSHRYVLVEDRGPVRILTLNEPERMNPIGDGLRHQLLEALIEAGSNASVRALVLTGAGRQFSAGADVKQMQASTGPDPLRSKRRMKVLHDVIRALAAGPKPVVAATEGAAFGAGLSVLCACDWIVAGEGARFGGAFGRIGLAADCGILWSLPPRIGAARTRDLLFTGRSVKAPEAVELGLCDELVGAGQALDRAIAKAESYLDTAPLSIASIKAAMAERPGDLERVLGIETHQQPMMSMTADHKEARAAFAEKRKPHFSGR